MDVDSFINKKIFEENLQSKHDPYLWKILFALSQGGYAHEYALGFLNNAVISIHEQTNYLTKDIVFNDPLQIDISTVYSRGFRFFIRNNDFFTHIYLDVKMEHFENFAYYLQVDFNNLLSKLLIKKCIIFLVENCLLGNYKLLPENIVIASNGCKLNTQDLLNLE